MPVNKEAIQRNYPGFTGHTDLITQLCETTGFVMMLATTEVAVSHVSAHVALKEAIERAKRDRIYQSDRAYQPRLATVRRAP